MTEEGVGIKVYFSVESQDSAFFSDYQGIDLRKGSVNRSICIIQGGDELYGIFEFIAFKSKEKCRLTSLEALNPVKGMNLYFKQFLGCFFSNFFDLHPAFGGDHQNIV